MFIIIIKVMVTTDIIILIIIIATDTTIPIVITTMDIMVDAIDFNQYLLKTLYLFKFIFKL